MHASDFLVGEHQICYQSLRSHVAPTSSSCAQRSRYLVYVSFSQSIVAKRPGTLLSKEAPGVRLEEE